MLARIALDADSWLCDSILGQLLPLLWRLGAWKGHVSSRSDQPRVTWVSNSLILLPPADPPQGGSGSLSKSAGRSTY